MQTNTVATLYHRTIVDREEHWARSVLPAVHWENRKAVNVLASGLLAADSVAVWIPDTSVVVESGDVLVKGRIIDEVDPTSFTMMALKNKYPNAVTVTSVDLYDYGSPFMRHLRIKAS